MSLSDKMAGIEPVRLSLDSNIKFRCHKDVKCFTKCCRDINITLTPYDIIRLKNRLNLSSEDFLAIYTTPKIMEKTDLPVITLKLLGEEGDEENNDFTKGACPFVREDGCLVYEDRPTTCRYYPLGSASLSHKEGSDKGEFFFFVNEPHCLGFEEDKTWAVKEWRKDQGVDIHDEINAGWTELIVRKRSFPPSIKLTDQSKKLFFMACYNMDKFKEFVFESSFLERFNVDKETVEKIREDEIALLEFSMKWLKGVLFNQGKYNPDEETKVEAEAEAKA